MKEPMLKLSFILYSFVHVDAEVGRGKITEIINELNGFSLKGSPIRVQLSTSGVRQRPGMSDDRDNCFRWVM